MPDPLSATYGAYVGHDGPTSARLAIVGEAPGEREVERRQPFVGPSGYLLNELLQAADTHRASVFVTNVARRRPPGNKVDAWFRKAEGSIRVLGRDILPPVAEGLRELYSELARVRPNVVVCMGNAALWALTGKWQITKWRGSLEQAHAHVAQQLGYRPKVIPTIHPAFVLRKWEWKNVVLHDLTRAVRESASSEYTVPDFDLRLRPSVQQTEAFFSWLRHELSQRRVPLAVDLETMLGHIECIGIATSPHKAIVIPFVGDEGHSYWSVDQEAWIVGELCALLTHRNAVCIGQNFNYDAQYTAKLWGFVPNIQHDTMVMQSVAFPGMLSGVMTKASGEKKTRREKEKGLDFLASLYAHAYTQWKVADVPYGEVYKDYDEYWRYAGLDVCYTWDVAQVLLRTIEAFGIRPAYDFQMQRLWPVALQSTLRGIRVDTERKQAVSRYLDSEEFEAQGLLEQYVPEDVLLRQKTPWYNSPKQKATLFYDILGQQPVLRERKTSAGYKRTPTTDDDAIETIGKREPLLLPICRQLLRLSSIGALRRNFIDAEVDDDGRIRGSLDIAGTETFRFSHRKNAFGTGTNLGNLKRTEEA